MYFRKPLFLWVVTLLLFFTLQREGPAAPVERGSRAREKQDLVSLIQRLKPGVVAVGTYYFNDVPKIRFHGTGFSVGKGNLIVTNNHVIARIEENKRLGQLRIFHKQLDPRGVKASLVEKDEAHDIALIQIDSGIVPPLELGDSARVQEGEAVAFTGYPIGFVLGLNPTTHAGIISAISPIVRPSPTARAIDKEIIDFLRQPYEIFQIDATAYPGNSGSPVYKISDGKVVGVINMVFVKGKKEHVLREPTGITYAIPVNFVKELVKRYGGSP